MSSQAKIEKVLRLLLLLSGKRPYSITELAERFQTSERTIYRYLDTFKTVGLIIDKNQYGYINLARDSSPFKALHELLHFSEEESYLLNQAIYAIDAPDSVHDSLTKKLHALYSSDRIALPILQKEAIPKVEKLITAHTQHKQVILKDYQSNNSNSTKDRLIEPYKFIRDFDYVIGYEVDSHACKMFKLSRLQSVELLKSDWQYEAVHQEFHVDIFRMSSPTKIPIRLKLNQRAYNILIDSHPLAINNLSDLETGGYLFDGWVCNFKGIEKFALGLLGNVEVLEPLDFRNYLNDKLKGFRF